jgi:Apea-like HEPN
MYEYSPHIKNEASGVVEIVRQHLKVALLELVPQWQAEPLSDWKRVVRPTGEGSYSINIEPYRGVQSWISFRKKMLGSEILNALENVIRNNQPSLLGYVYHPGGSKSIQDIFGLTIFFCNAALRHVENQFSIEAAVECVITELDTVLASSSAMQEVLTALSGLRLPEGLDRIDLDNSLYLRRLTASELSELGSNDISSESRYDITSRFITTALVSTRAVRITLSETYEEFTPDLAHLQESQDQIDAVLCALHLLKSGRVGVVASFTTIHPTILPNMSGHSSSPLVVNPFSFMELSAGEAEMFVKLYKKFISNNRDEVKIAAVRLLDAESRLSPVDSLLDAVIGLEVLLNPNDYAELSFRVALNYAYLSNQNERRSRYENVRDIQKTRNRIVHGGLNLKSKNAALIHEHADLARKCLRDAVTRFLIDNEFSGNAKLDADFWLDRVIPPNK